MVTNGAVNNPKGTLYLDNNTSGYKFYNVNAKADTSIMAKLEQPNTQIYTGITVENDSLKITSYTADSNSVYDSYTINRTDTAPDKVEDFTEDYSQVGKVTLRWTAVNEAKSYMLYENNNSIKVNWTLDIAAVNGQTQYSTTIDVDNTKQYDFTIKAMGSRAMSDASSAIDPVKQLMQNINSLPATIILADSSTVSDLRNSYNKLTDGQKALITNLSRLVSAEVVLAQLAGDRIAADLVIAKIDAIPATLSISDQPAVMEAKLAYDQLTDVQKALITNKNKLGDALNRLTALSRRHDSATGITIESNNIPENASLVISSVTNHTNDTFQLMQQKTDGEKLLALFDISLVQNNSEIEPTGKVKITIPLPPELRGLQDLKIVHYKDDGSLEYITPYIHDDVIEFETDSLSYYGIVSDSAVPSVISPNTNATTNPNTGDSNNLVYLTVFGASLLFVLIGVKIRKEKFK